ncbi:Ribulose-5-phosphate 4-epimerase/Fuculose-1-phosphate aldolase [Sphingomonas laterariae]|uniref:Ribulose-5-phosphate 4-epimerase/Fuculose-1-phosphate aldolase n=1 Tax=Edaphosphingomonas laterariae TaxID=861865 RepID=A0A239IGC6_9SPHN|nr:class II aldolase/adducin family protein [Sphingomonas laterariae]SNS92647.1 Ribulose-5-phosphate 4-epimerase/Fuculose-1-phosphate aldolase [Sphingomonas laterariae]
MATAQPLPGGISEAEWAARQQLAACYRVFDHLGWTELIFNHITLRVPGEDGAFLINPFGLHFSEVTASSLVKIDIDGQILSDSQWGVNLAGFVQHAAFHRHLPDAHCVMHTHTTAGMAVACLEGGLSISNFYAGQVAGQIAYHDFEGITVRDDEAPRLIANLGDKRLMILRNHGLLSMGPTLPIAFLRLWALERACQIQMASAPMGQLREIPADVLIAHQRDEAKLVRPGMPGEAEFNALVRLVDRKDPSWRD